jgi:GT2 family glycosyltransferase
MLESAVYVVMLNWNSYKFNAECIRSFQSSTLKPERIVVVDNGSTDGSIERLEAEFDEELVHIVRNAKNEGFARGMNTGIRCALSLGAELVFSVNNDTVVDPDCLRLLTKAIISEPCAGIAGPAILFHNSPERIWQAGGYFKKLRAGVTVPGKGRTIQELAPSVTRVSFLTGCAVLIRREVFEKIGYLDTSYFFYSEDLDFDLRVLAGGFTLLFVPSAKVWHKIDEVAKDRTSPYVLYHLARSSIMVFRKRFKFPYAWYGIMMQMIVYTPFRFWQVLVGGSGWQACQAWVKGLRAGLCDDVSGARP